jgi:succinoglycan biosynthesis protein ExoA
LITIILPIRNEFKHISNTLDSINNQDYINDEIEIIVADGMSDDGTREILKHYQKKINNLIVINNPERIVPTGFNSALNISRGEIIVRLDGHTIIAPNYITRCVELLCEKDAMNVGGLMNAEGYGIYDEIVSIATSSKFGVGNSHFHYSKKGKWTDTVYLGAWKREVFKKIGGFDEELVRNQDDEFNFRIIQNNGRIWLDPSVKSSYYPRNSIKKLFKQYFQYGFYKVRVIQKRGGFTSWRHLIPGTFVLSLLLSLLLLPRAYSPFFIIMGSYVIANVYASFISLIRSKNTLNNLFSYKLFLLPITFFIIHFSYGLGFLFGLVKFWNKWKDQTTKDHHFNREEYVNKTTENYK